MPVGPSGNGGGGDKLTGPRCGDEGEGMSSRAASPTKGERGEAKASGDLTESGDRASEPKTTSRSSCNAGTGRSSPGAETWADRLGEFRSARNGGDKEG